MAVNIHKIYGTDQDEHRNRPHPDKLIHDGFRAVQFLEYDLSRQKVTLGCQEHPPRQVLLHAARPRPVAVGDALPPRLRRLDEIHVGLHMST